MTKVSTSQDLPAKAHRHQIFAKVIQNMNIDASFVTDSLSHRSLANTCRTRTFVELAHAKSLSTTSWNNDALLIGECKCNKSQVSNLQMPIGDCACDLDIALRVPKKERDLDKLAKHLAIMMRQLSCPNL